MLWCFKFSLALGAVVGVLLLNIARSELREGTVFGFPGLQALTASLKPIDVGLGGPHSVVAFGDFNSDRFVDVFLVDEKTGSIYVFLWDQDLQRFKSCNARINMTMDNNSKIVSVVPLDFNNDGRLDLLVTFKHSSDSFFQHSVYLGDQMIFCK